MSTRRSLFHSTVFVLAALAVSSCAPTGNLSSGSIAPQADNSILVDNRNWADIKVYALRGGSKYRLGSVTSFTSARLRLPASITSASDFRIRVELIGSHESYTTEVLYLTAGARMDLTVTSHLPMSMLAVRR